MFFIGYLITKGNLNFYLINPYLRIKSLKHTGKIHIISKFFLLRIVNAARSAPDAPATVRRLYDGFVQLDNNAQHTCIGYRKEDIIIQYKTRQDKTRQDKTRQGIKKIVTCSVYTCTAAYTGQVTFYKVPEKHGHVKPCHPVSQYLYIFFFLNPYYVP